MRIEGIITSSAKFGRMVGLQIADNRVFVDRAVYEDLGSLSPGVKLAVECVKNEKQHLTATSVTVLSHLTA